MKSLQLNSLLIGLISGIILPLVTMICFYFFRRVEESFSGFLRMTFEYAILSKLISLAAIPDALLFFTFIWTNKLKSARGVIFAMFILCLLVFIIKFAL
jgi:hypothetical protein